MSSRAQRKAWNEAMKNAGAVLPTSSATAASSLTAASDRSRKATRREKARKSSAFASATAASSHWEERQYRVAIHMDMLEGVVDNTNVLDENDDEYDEYEELDLRDGDDDDDHEDNNENSNSNRAGSKRKKRRRTGNASSNMPKYLRPRSLASILIEEASRSDSMAKLYVVAAVKSLSDHSGKDATSKQDGTTTRIITKPYPPRKFCPVTGLLAEYTDPKSGIPYASLSALEQIRERAPPWMNAMNGGTASYWEAMNTLKSDL